jgi:hypothetical protein
MVSSGMLRRVTLVRTDVSEELSDSIISVTRIGELGTLVRSFSSVFVRHTFNYPNYFKTLKHLTFVTTCFGLYGHHQVLKLRFEEVAAFPFS